jgi:hypothetical protein
LTGARNVAATWQAAGMSAMLSGNEHDGEREPRSPLKTFDGGASC